MSPRCLLSVSSCRDRTHTPARGSGTFRSSSPSPFAIRRSVVLGGPGLIVRLFRSSPWPSPCLLLVLGFPLLSPLCSCSVCFLHVYRPRTPACSGLPLRPRLSASPPGLSSVEPRPPKKAVSPNVTQVYAISVKWLVKRQVAQHKLEDMQHNKTHKKSTHFKIKKI